VDTKVITGVATIAAIAIPVTQAQLPGRVSTLERQVKTLQGQVRTLTGTVTPAVQFSQCLRSAPPIGVARYGGLNNEGYVYGTAGGAQLALTSALDVADQGEVPGAYFPTVNPQCIRASAGREVKSSQRLSTFEWDVDASLSEAQPTQFYRPIRRQATPFYVPMK